MKRLIFLIFFLPGFVFAKPVSFDFGAVSLVTFAQATFKSIMGRDYVIAPDVVAMDRKITISVKNIDSDAVPAFVENLLTQQGIRTSKRGEVYYLEAITENRLNEAPKAIAPVESSEIAFKTGKYDTFSNKDQSISSLNNRASMQVQEIKDDPDAESKIYSPINRPADFIRDVINSSFSNKPAQLAGSNIIITAKKEKLEKILFLLESIDISPPKVDIHITWVEVTRTSGNNRGVSLIASFLGTKFGFGLGAITSASTVSIQRANFQLIVDALNTDSRFNQVSSSQMVGDDYQKMNLTVGDETPTVSSTGKDNAGNPVQNIVYRQAGSIVDVLPKVLANGKINLAIDGQISSFKATATGVNGSPTLTKRQIKTEVTLKDDEVLMIGGLNESQNTSNASGLSFLPASWTAKSGNGSNTDLVLILSAKRID